MKRDLDLCREILLYIEEYGKPSEALEIDFKDYSDEEISYNLDLLSEAGYMELTTGSAEDKLVWGRISWDGHEYLAAIKDDKTWNKAKEHIKSKIGSASFSVLLQVLNEFAKRSIFPT